MTWGARQTAHRRHIKELTGRSAEDLGFLPPSKQRNSALIANIVPTQNALTAESDLFNTMELAHTADASDIGPGTLETIEEAVELLSRAYPSTPAAVLKERTKQRLKYVLELLKGRVTLEQHRAILVHAGWLAALLGCLHYDLGEAKGQARLGNQTESRQALERGAVILGKIPTPARPDHHFVFDHTKWIYYAATIYTWQGDEERAEEHAQEIISRHTRPDGTTNAPMRTANARVDLAIVNARRGDLDTAVDLGLSAFDFERRSLTDLISRGEELDHVLRTKYRREKLAREFHEQLVTARRALNERRPELLD